MEYPKMVKCWFCAEEILPNEKKCKNCGEWVKPLSTKVNIVYKKRNEIINIKKKVLPTVIFISTILIYIGGYILISKNIGNNDDFITFDYNSNLLIKWLFFGGIVVFLSYLLKFLDFRESKKSIKLIIKNKKLLVFLLFFTFFWYIFSHSFPKLSLFLALLFPILSFSIIKENPIKSKPKSKDILNMIFILVSATIMGVISLKSLFESPINRESSSYSSNSTTPSKKSMGQYILKEHYFRASNKEDLGLLIKLSAQNDRNAIDKLISSRRVFLVKGGTKVYLDDSGGLLSGMVKVRPEGESYNYWVLREAIQ